MWWPQSPLPLSRLLIINTGSKFTRPCGPLCLWKRACLLCAKETLRWHESKMCAMVETGKKDKPLVLLLQTTRCYILRNYQLSVVFAQAALNSYLNSKSGRNQPFPITSPVRKNWYCCLGKTGIREGWFHWFLSPPHSSSWCHQFPEGNGL